MNLPALTLQRPVTFTMIFLACLALGGIALAKLRLAYLPTVDFPKLWIELPYRGADPREIERLIVRPVEAQLSTLAGIKGIRSLSREDTGLVILDFDFGQELEYIKVRVREKLELARADLPDDFQKYFIWSFNTNDIPLMVGRISSNKDDLLDKYEFFERQLKAPLERIAGVGRVQIFGLEEAEVRLYFTSRALAQYRIDLSALVGALMKHGLDRPIGDIREGGRVHRFRSLGAFRSQADLLAFPVPGTPGLTIGDVAEVLIGRPRPANPRRLNGSPALGFAVTKVSGANSVEVSRRVHATLEELRMTAAFEGLDLHVFHDEAKSITEGLSGLLGAGLEGGVIACVILVLFLWNLADTLIVALAVPLCVLFATAGLYVMGKTINLMTLMGMALSVGMAIDNSIVVLENINRLRAKRTDPGDQSHILAGASEVGLAISVCTLTHVIIFLPILYGASTALTIWLKDVAWTISLTLGSSMLVSLTLVPLLLGWLEKRRAPPPPEHHRDHRFFLWMRRKYSRAMIWALRHPILFLVGVILILASGAIPHKMKWISAEVDDQVIHDLVRLELEFPGGADIDRVEATVAKVEKAMEPVKATLGLGDIFSSYQHSRANIDLYLKRSDLSPEEFRLVRDQVLEKLPDLPGVVVESGKTSEQQEEAWVLPVHLFSEDSDRLEEWGERALAMLAKLPDVKRVEREGERRTREIEVIPERLRYGTAASELSDTMRFTLRGTRVSSLIAGETELGVYLLMHPDDRQGMEDLGRLTVGKEVRTPMGAVSSYRFRSSDQEIQRMGEKRVFSIRLEADAEKTGPVQERVKAALDQLAWPTGMSWSFGERILEEEEDNKQMMFNILMAIFLVFLVMASLFEALGGPFLILFSIPFSMVGAIWFLAICRVPLGVMASIGIFLLIGIVVSNGILLVDCINILRSRGHGLARSLVTAGNQRLRPILMTTLTAALGMAPMALGKAAVGKAMYAPLAYAIIGGLTFSTICTLVFTPWAYAVMERWRGWGRYLWRALVRQEPLVVTAP